MLETIDGGAKSRKTLQADTSWEPDFEDNDFASSNNVVPNIVTPSESSVECSFDGWALSDNEMEAISQYSKKPSSDSPPPPPREIDVTTRTSNVKTLNTSPDSSSGGKRRGKLSSAKKKYEKYINKSSPKATTKKEAERELTEEEKVIAKGVAAKQRERRESKKNKFKKMIKSKNKMKTPSKEVSPDPTGFDPWLTAAAEETPEAEEEGGNVWENGNEECAKDEGKVEEQAEEGHEIIENIMASTPVKNSSSFDIKSQDIFRPKDGPSALPSPASKEINDVLKDVQNNLEVSAISKSSSALHDDSVDFEYDFNLESSQLDASEQGVQTNVDTVDEESADEDGIVATDDEDQIAGKEQEEDVPPPPGKLSLFTCGMIDVEVTSPKQVMVDFTRDLKTGMRNSVRNFFGVCDVGEGADVVAQNVEETKKTWKQNVNKTRDHTKDYVAFGYKKE